MEKDLVSVIIPTYNRAKTIERAISSVQRQTYKYMEIIIVDDGSGDDTYDIVKALCKKDARVKYIKNSRNLGVAGARNVGILKSEGEFIAFNDSDDIWHEDKLEKQLKEFAKEEYAMVYSAFMQNSLTGLKRRIPDLNAKELFGDMFNRLLHENVISTQTMLIKREVFDSIGLFAEGLRAWDDYELALRIAYKYKIGYVNEELVDVYLSKDSISGLERNYLGHYFAAITILKEYWDLIEDKGRLTLPFDVMYNSMKLMEKNEFEVYASEASKYIVGNYSLYNKFVLYNRLTYKEYVMNALNEISVECLKNYFKENGYYQIAIYGDGYIGKYLRMELEKAGIEVLYTIDRKPKKREYSVLSMSEKLPKVDLVIVTIYDVDNKVCESLLEKMHCKVKNIQDLFNEI